MLQRIAGLVAAVTVALAAPALGQATRAAQGPKEPVSDGRTLSQWVAELKAAAPETRNAAVYEIASLGPAAAPAVPALIAALDDPAPSVRFPATVALREIGPAAKAAVPRLKQMIEEEINDEVAAGARRALRAIDPSAVPPESDDD